MLRSWRACATFHIRYRGRLLEEWFGVHEALKDGYTDTEDGMFSEFKAMRAHGMSAEQWYAQPREMRILKTGGIVADGALGAMEQHDRAAEAESRRKAEK